MHRSGSRGGRRGNRLGISGETAARAESMSMFLNLPPSNRSSRTNRDVKRKKTKPSSSKILQIPTSNRNPPRSARARHSNPVPRDHPENPPKRIHPRRRSHCRARPHPPCVCDALDRARADGRRIIAFRR